MCWLRIWFYSVIRKSRVWSGHIFRHVSLSRRCFDFIFILVTCCVSQRARIRVGPSARGSPILALFPHSFFLSLSTVCLHFLSSFTFPSYLSPSTISFLILRFVVTFAFYPLCLNHIRILISISTIAMLFVKGTAVKATKTQPSAYRRSSITWIIYGCLYIMSLIRIVSLSASYLWLIIPVTRC